MERLQSIISHLKKRPSTLDQIPCSSPSDLFLGIDSSTQSCKVLVINQDGSPVYEDGVNFQRDFPEYKTDNGVYKQGLEATAPTMMFVEALDTVLTKMVKSGKVDVSKIVCASASGQQHGTVYWAIGAQAKLNNLSPNKGNLKDQLSGAFSIPNGPIWMDSSTSAFCTQMEAVVGGSQRVASLSGSRAYERFSGPQISKVFATNRQAYNQTERISLVSSFLPSVLTGNYCPIDGSDACGTNLVDIHKLAWSNELLQAAVSPPNSSSSPEAAAQLAQELKHKLGELAWSHAVCGVVHPYFVNKFGFSPQCAVVCGSGDNPCTIAGLRLEREGDVGISLGTSDTVFAIIATHSIAPSGEEGHMLRNPVDPSSCMAMLCYKNGSVTRERVRTDAGAKDWQQFNQLLSSRPAGNHGYVGYFYLEPEIIPRFNASKTFRYGPDNTALERFPDAATELRALVEQQFLSMRVHAAKLGMLAPKRVIATGGASVNTALLKVIASVFGCNVYTASAGPNTAALGAAYRAMQGYASRSSDETGVVPLNQLVQGDPFKLAATPDAAQAHVYSGMLARFTELEARALSSV